MTWSLHALMWTFSTTAKLTADLAEATWHALDYWKRQTTRHVGANTGQSISPRIKTLEREYKGIEGEIRTLERKLANQGKVGAAKSSPVGMNISGRIRVLERKLHGIDAQIAKLTHGEHVLGQRIGAQGKVVPRTAPRVVPRTRAPARHWTDILTKTAAAALVGASLARLGLKWIRCPNVGKFGKWLCGSPASLMDALLAALTLVIATEGIVPFAHQVEDIFGSATGFVRKFWHVNAIGSGGDRAIGENRLTALD